MSRTIHSLAFGCAKSYPNRVELPDGLYTQQTEFSKKVLKEIPPGEGILPWTSHFSTPFQTYTIQTWVPMFGGYSGKALLNSEMLYRLIGSSANGRDAVRDILLASQAHWIAALSESDSDQLLKTGLLNSLGCYSNFELHICLL